QVYPLQSVVPKRDITHCGFWLLGFLKKYIYRIRPASVPELKDSFRRHVLDIPADSL
ncbi:unnamed protein product, partial [Larinioides sclopetarius]